MEAAHPHLEAFARLGRGRVAPAQPSKGDGKGRVNLSEMRTLGSDLDPIYRAEQQGVVAYLMSSRKCFEHSAHGYVLLRELICESEREESVSRADSGDESSGAASDEIEILRGGAQGRMQIYMRAASLAHCSALPCVVLTNILMSRCWRLVGFSGY